MAASHSSAEHVRLSELLVVLSLGADLGMGQPMEHALRQCVLALRIGDCVRALGTPTLLVAGDADALIPLPAMLATWAKLPPGSGLHVWHGVGHSPNLDCPVALADLLTRFIEETIPARSTAQRPLQPAG